MSTTIDYINVTSTPAYEESEHMKTTIFIFGIILTTVFCVAGSLGNIVAMMVTVRMMYQRHLHPLFAIFTALILSDTLVLVLTLMTNVICVGYPYTRIQWTIPLFLNHGPIIIILWPILLACQTSSTYLTVLVSYERYIAVCKPFRSSQCSFKRFCRWIIVTSIISVVYNSPRWWEYTVLIAPVSPEEAKIIPAPYLCTASKLEELNMSGTRYADLATAVGIICNATTRTYDKSSFGGNLLYRYIYGAGLYALFIFFVPVILLTYFNVALVIQLRASRREWMRMSRSQRKEMKLTTLPLTIVILFYILGIPAVLINLCDSLTDSINTQMPLIGAEAWQAFLTVSNFLVILNSSINFLIYCFAGRKFRQTLLIMCCLTCNNRFGNHLSTVSNNILGMSITQEDFNDSRKVSCKSRTKVMAEL